MASGTLIFETERLIVREYLVSDLMAIHDYAQQAEVVQYQNWGPNELYFCKPFSIITNKKES